MAFFTGKIYPDHQTPEFTGGIIACNPELQLTVMFAGVCYNLTELGLSASPAETALQLFLLEGPASLGKLNGAFAVVILDHRQNSLLLLRDRLGEMPLFYFHSREQFGFANSLSRLKTNPAMPRQINPQAIHDYLSLQYIPAPMTIYQDVFKMPPATLGWFNLKDGSRNFQPYWQPDFQRKTELSPGDAATQLRHLLEQSVKRRVAVNPNYGAFLSGGLDSSITTGLVAGQTPHSLKTFTIGFDNPDYDERERARHVVEIINHQANHPLVPHTKVICPDDFQVFVTLVHSYGEPYSDASLLPTHLLCRWAAEEIRFGFTGDGADELFAGYERYLMMRYAAMLPPLPAPLAAAAYGGLAALIPGGGNERSRSGRLHRVLRTLAASPANRYFDLINRFSETARQSVYGSFMRDFPLLPTHRVINDARLLSSGRNQTEICQEIDMRTYMPGDVLPKAAIAAANAGIITASPFLDYDVIDFANSLPRHYKQSGTSRKHLLKQAFRDYLPPEVANLRKKGFGVPVADWLRGPWRELMQQHLLEGKLISGGFCRREPLEKMITRHLSGRADVSYPLWALTVLDVFLEQMDQPI